MRCRGKDRSPSAAGRRTFPPYRQFTPICEFRHLAHAREVAIIEKLFTLPITFGKILRLPEVEEYYTEETAKMLERSIDMVESRVPRGRQKLAEALTKYFRRSELADFLARNSI